MERDDGAVAEVVGAAVMTATSDVDASGAVRPHLDGEPLGLGLGFLVRRGRQAKQVKASLGGRARCMLLLEVDFRSFCFFA